jgi:hypothetical protein
MAAVPPPRDHAQPSLWAAALKIVFLVPRTLYDTKMSRVRFQQWRAIGQMEGNQSHITGPEWPDWDLNVSAGVNVDRVRLGENENANHNRAELVVTYKAGFLDHVRPPVVVQFNEADDWPKTMQEIHEANARLVVFHHGNDLPQYRYIARVCPTAVRTLVHVHHCADTTVYRDYGLPKDIDILCAGNMSQQFYPFRYRLMRLAWTVFRKRGYRVEVLKHPGYTLPPRAGTVIGEDFARMLNRSKLVFTCSMRFKYALAKYSEIALCRSLAVGDIPDERQEFFQKTILNVEPYMTDEEIVRIVEECLDTEGRLEALTANSYDLTMRTSTMQHYAQMFMTAVGGLLS